MRKQEMIEKRATNAREARAIADKAAQENRSLTDAERDRVKQLETENTTLTTRIDDQNRIDEMERRAGATPVGQSMPDLARAVEEFRTGLFIAHRAGIVPADRVSRELEVVQQYANGGEGDAVPFAAFLPPPEKRALLYSGGSGSGAGTVFEQELPDAIPALRDAIIAGLLGARILPGLSGAPVSISKITTGKTAAYIAEDSAGTPSDAATDKVQMTGKHAIALTSVSRSLLTQASPAAMQLVNDDVMASVFGAIDRTALVGGGANEPSGVWDQLTPTALTLDWASVLEVQEAVQIANVPGARLGWAQHPSAARVLRSTPKLQIGSPVQTTVGDFIQESARVLADYPVFQSTAIPTSGSPPSTAGLIYGDWSQLVIGIWESVNLLVNPYSEAEFRRGNVAIRAIATTDCALRYSEAFQARTVAI